MQTLTFKGYVGKFADSSKRGVDEVFAFLNAAGRSSQVYARLYEKVISIRITRLLLLVNRVGNISGFCREHQRSKMSPTKS